MSIFVCVTILSVVSPRVFCIVLSCICLVSLVLSLLYLYACAGNNLVHVLSSKNTSACVIVSVVYAAYVVLTFIQYCILQGHFISQGIMMLGGVFYEIYGTRDVVECHKSCKAQSHQHQIE